MATKKQMKDFAEMVDTISNMSRKNYRDLWRITKQYRKAHKMLEKSLDRQEREFMMPSKSSNTSLGDLNYELQ